jgi:hypothetical protein
MHRRFSAAAIAACSLLLVFSHGAPAQTGATIKVKLNYTGSATVDESHKIAVALWDSPGFTQGTTTPPIAVQTTTSKTGTVTFDNVTANPAYVSCALDPTGKWDAQSGPPAGSSLGMYSKTPGKPAPIDTTGGKTATVTITFDDSVKAH